MQFATGELGGGGGGKENRNVSQQSFIHHDKSVLTVFITCKISAKKEKNWFQFPEKFHFGRRGLPALGMRMRKDWRPLFFSCDKWRLDR